MEKGLFYDLYDRLREVNFRSYSPDKLSAYLHGYLTVYAMVRIYPWLETEFGVLYDIHERAKEIARWYEVLVQKKELPANFRAGYAADLMDVYQLYSDLDFLEKGVDAASFHAYDRQVKELAVLRGLERLRPEWDTVLDGTEKALYQNGETAYQAICEEFHRTWGAAGERRAEWENIGEQLLMFFVYTYFCGAVYDDMVCSKMELALFSVRWIQEILVARWLENGKTLSMHDIEELSWRYAREVEHSDDNLNALEDWLFETYAPEGCVLEEE